MHHSLINFEHCTISSSFLLLSQCNIRAKQRLTKYILLVFQKCSYFTCKILVVDLSCSFQIVNILRQFTIDGWWMNSRQRKQVGVTITRLGNSGDLKLSAYISLWLKRKWNIYVLYWLITGFKASLDQRGNLTLVKHLLPSIASTNLLLQNSPLLMEGKNRRKIQL